MTNERRYMVLAVADNDVLALLNGRAKMADLGLPADVQVESIYVDYTRRCTCLVLESATFAPVPLGCTIPYLPPLVVTQTWRDRPSLI